MDTLFEHSDESGVFFCPIYCIPLVCGNLKYQIVIWAVVFANRLPRTENGKAPVVIQFAPFCQLISLVNWNCKAKSADFCALWPPSTCRRKTHRPSRRVFNVIFKASHIWTSIPSACSCRTRSPSKSCRATKPQFDGDSITRGAGNPPNFTHLITIQELYGFWLHLGTA